MQMNFEYIHTVIEILYYVYKSIIKSIQHINPSYVIFSDY